MSNDLLKQLEEKINAAIETIELSRMEITELKEQNDELENRYVDWEDRLSALIDKFEQLEDGEKENSEEVVEEELDTASQSEDNLETSSQSEEELEASSQSEEELESSGKFEEEFEPSNNKANGEVEGLSHEENDLDEDIQEIATTEDQSDVAVFGSNPESFTESPESSQHYA